MDREQAINYLQSSGFSEEQITEIEQAFKGDPCDDAISRQAAIDAMREDTCGCCWDAKYILKHLPSVSTEKTGQWGKEGECPFCGYFRQWENDNFCGNCGAKMEVEE